MCFTISIGPYLVHLSSEEIHGSKDEVDVIANNILSVEELEVYENFKFDKRRKDWLFGRKAARELVGARCSELPGNMSNTCFSITTIPGGAPILVVKGEHLSHTQISITHSGEVAMAALATNPLIRGLGVDVEVIGARPYSFIQTAFSKQERSWLEKYRDEALWAVVALRYTLKEAVSKALGVGFSVNTHSIEILGYRGNESVALHGKANERMKLLSGKQFFLQTGILEDIVGKKWTARVGKKYALSTVVMV